MQTKPPTLHIEIDAVWHNGKWRVVDANGSPCQALNLKALLPRRTRASAAGLSDAWAITIRKMSGRLKGEEYSARTADPWKRRLASMTACINEREPSRGKSRERHKVGTTWPQRFVHMRQNLAFRSRRARQLNDEWTLWARGTASSMQKRQARRGRDGSQTASTA